MRSRQVVRAAVVVLCASTPVIAQRTAARPPYLDSSLPIDRRVNDLVGRMTLEEKVSCLATNPSLPRFGIVASGHVEGLHGLSQGGPGKWGKDDPIPTTTFCQAIGLGETWDPDNGVDSGLDHSSRCHTGR